MRRQTHSEGQEDTPYIGGQLTEPPDYSKADFLKRGGEANVAREADQSLAHLVMRHLGFMVTLHNSVLTARTAPSGQLKAS